MGLLLTNILNILSISLLQIYKVGVIGIPHNTELCCRRTILIVDAIDWCNLNPSEKYQVLRWSNQTKDIKIEKKTLSNSALH